MKKRSVKDFWAFLRRTNLHLMILSFIFAFLIWCYVIAGTNPTRMKDVDAIPLSLINTEELSAKGLTLADLSDVPETVDVKVEAHVESHKNISADTIRATVNLAEINSQGEVTLSVNAVSTMSGVSVKSVSPAQITLQVDNLVEREIPVTAELTGTAKEGYYVEAPELSRSVVNISGPDQTISRIVRAVCEVPIGELTKNTSMSYALKLYDKDDQEVPLNQMTSELPSVIVDLKVLPTKRVPISEKDVIDAVTNIKKGYEIKGVVVEPATVEIAAEQDVLDKIDSVRIQPLNAEQAEKSVMLDVAIQPLDNVEYISHSTLEVLVQIEEIQGEKTLKNHEIEIRNLEEGLKAKIDGGKYTELTLSGGKTAIDQITSASVHVYVDMAGITAPGKYTRTVEIEEMTGVSQTTLTRQEVTVMVTRSK